MQKVMSAMNMIASTKLRKLLMRQPVLKQFSTLVDSIGDDLISGLRSFESPLIHAPDKIRNSHIIVITADKGLCGSHNSSVLRALTKTWQEENQQGVAVDLTCIGARARNLCRRRDFKVCHGIDSNEQHISDTVLREIAFEIVERVKRGEVDKVVIIYNHFVSTLVQKTQQLQIFPLIQEKEFNKEQSGRSSQETEAETEPRPEDFILPAANLYLYYKLKIALTDSYLSEHAARMTAMEKAKTNAEDLINRYVKIRNRARQDTITSELIEIVAGTEALNN